VKVFRGLPNAESRAPCALTIGNFDGVHRGHQALLMRVKEAANAQQLPVCVMTFEPHPREFFQPAGAPPRIALLRDKLEALREYGVDRVVVEHFNRNFANQSPDGFVERTLVNGLHTRWIMVGDDFCYGAKRAGNFASLQAAGIRHGFTVEHLATVTDPDGMRISSSSVRAALAAGDLDTAARALGRSYAISGHVIHGRKLGTQLGFPTLNLPIAHKRPALTGIYIVRVHGVAAKPLPGVASLGLRPTVSDSGRVLLETHLLDWSGNAYGKLVRVEFLKKLRDEAKFSSLAALEHAIAQDVELAHAYFAANRRVSSRPTVAFTTPATDRIS